MEPMVQGTRENFQAIGAKEDIFEKTKLTADAGFHTEQQWKLFCIVHNLLKIHRYGPGFA
jgi:hypothetical protein